MILVAFLWLLVWGGMFTSITGIQTGVFLDSPKDFIQGVRSLFPLIALFLCFLWVLKDRPRFPFRKNPLLYWYGYVSVGILASLFLSPEPLTAIYWAGIYLAPLVVVWFVMERDEPWSAMRILIYTNYAVFGLIAFSLLPEAFRVGWGNLPPFRQYTLMLGIGQITTNGAGRYALTVLIVLAVRFLMSRGRARYLLIPFMVPFLFLLTQTQSRTALLGLAVAVVLFVVMRGSDWRFLFVGPAVVAILYTSGFQWRSHGSMDRLMNLTGREYTWEKGVTLIEQSPFLGWGFQADRIMMNSEHMHNSYLHAAIHTGAVGLVFFIAALASLWWMIFRMGLLRRAKHLSGERRILLFESVMIVGYLTSRSFFESTAAFYGVDLLLFIPAIAYIALAAYQSPNSEPSVEESTSS
jgi:O-antigen ligase